MPCARFHSISSSIALTIASMLGGCNQGEQLTYQQAYEQKHYAQALDKATLVAQDDHAQDQQRAALVAGMSAQSLGKYDEAKKWLIPLKLSPDKDIAGRARASLGLIAKAEGKPAEAATLLAGSGISSTATTRPVRRSAPGTLTGSWGWRPRPRRSTRKRAPRRSTRL